MKKPDILLSFSAGPDSVYLSTQLRKTHTILLIYFDHGLRDITEEIALTRAQNLPYIIKKIPVKAYAKKHDISIEMAGRHYRYTLLKHYQKLHNIPQVATAHHLDDHIETFYLNFHRGYHHYLAGIRQEQSFGTGTLMRPILNTPKSDILSYLHTHNIPYCKDPTNQNLDYTRNQWRNKILPILETYYPSYRKTLKKQLQIFAEESDFLNQQTAPYISNIQKTRNGISWTIPPNFSTLHPALQKRIIATILHPNATFKHIQILQKALQSNIYPKRYDLPNNVTCDCLQNTLVISHAVQEITPKYTYETYSPIKSYKSSQTTAYLNADSLQNRELTIRTRQTGDRFQPYGSPHEISLKKYMINQKIPRSIRNQLPLFFNGDTLVWIMGHRIHHHYRITPETKSILKIEVNA